MTKRSFLTIAGARNPLFACIHHPKRATRRGKTGVIFFHAVGSYRAGPHDLLAQLAESAAMAGFLGLRFDFGGHGDSLRYEPRPRHDRPFPSVLADMVRDANVVKRHFVEEHDLDQVVTVGICSGAMAGFRSFLEKPVSGESGIILLAIPPLNLFSVRYFFSRMWSTARTYGRKALRPTTWKRLVQGEIDFRSITRAFIGKIGRRKSGDVSSSPRSSAPAAKGTPSDDEVDSEQEMHAATETEEAPASLPTPVSWLPREVRESADTSGKRVLMVVPKDDVARGTVIRTYTRLFSKLNLNAEIKTVPGADHSFSSRDATRAVEELVADWLDQCLGERGDTGNLAEPSDTPKSSVVESGYLDNGIWHVATSDMTDAERIAILVAPMFTERNSAYSTMSMLAIELARAGWRAVSYDARGFGESSNGNGGAPRWRDLQDDLGSVIDHVRDTHPKAAIHLVGLRLGATLALLEAESPTTIVKSIVALEPIVNGKTYVRQLTSVIGSLQSQPTTDDKTRDINGMSVSRNLLEDISGLDLRKITPVSKTRCSFWSLQKMERARREIQELFELRHTDATDVRRHDRPGLPFWNRVGELAPPRLVGDVVQEMNELSA